MNINAFKMDGLGNDFVIIDNRENKVHITKDIILKICDRNFQGCDQLILVNKSKVSDAELIFYNSDGSESATCGNGTRCVAYLLFKEKNKTKIYLKTKSGNLSSIIYNQNQVETIIGRAKTNWKEIPIIKNLNTKNLNFKITDNTKNIFTGGTAVNVGNPHLIFFVDNLNNFDLERIGSEFENSEMFPDRCNVTIAKIENVKEISVKVWERGVGLTKACGSAACATAYAARMNNLTGNEVDIIFDLGKLSISIDGNDLIKMKGPVSDIKKIDIKV